MAEGSVLDQWHFGVDPDPEIHASDSVADPPDPDPAIFFIDLQDTNKKLIWKKKGFSGY